MENISLKNILWIIGGIVAGYYLGAMIGSIMGMLLWAFMALILEDFVYHSLYSMLINTLLSAVLGILAALLVPSVTGKLLGSKMSFWTWGIIGLVIGLAVMFSYGTHALSNPETYFYPGRIIPSPKVTGIVFGNTVPSPYSELHFGAGTGYLIASYIGALAGFLLPFRELILKKRNPEDKKEFDEYSKFFEERLKK